MKANLYKITAVVLIIAAASAIFLRLTKDSDILSDVDFSTAIYDKNGSLLRLTLANDEIFRVRAQLSEISPNLIKATLLYEDRYFYYHPGVNIIALGRGFISYISNDKRPLGASTITMQFARLKYKLNSKTISGKALQILYAILLEVRYSKDEILEGYLNLAPYGHNIEGVSAAALIYFDSSCKKLSSLESITLAVIPQNPSGRTPTSKQGMVNIIDARKRLVNKWEDDDSFKGLLNLGVSVKNVSQLEFKAPHFVNNILSKGAHGAIISTLDMNFQKILEERIETFVRRNKSKGVNNAAALLVDYTDMSVVAYAGSADFFNEKILGQVDGIISRRSPGSTFKPFIFALALDQGLIHPKSMMKDAQKRFGTYSPENADRAFMGPLLAYEALIHSRNIPAVDLLSRLDNSSYYELLKKTVANMKEEGFYGTALALGGFETSMLETGALYGALANFGRYRCINFIKDEPCTREGFDIMSAEAAYLTFDMLTNNQKPKEYSNLGIVAWKTGTSFGFKDAWSAGIFSKYVLVVWSGNFDGSGSPIFTGRGLAGQLFFSIINGIKMFDKSDWVQPIPKEKLNIKEVDICAPTGDLADKLCPKVEKGLFIVGVSPIKVSNVFREVAIDNATGLRACGYNKSDSRIEVYEFWESDINDLFKKAGVYKRTPPPYMKGCDIDDIAQHKGLEPVITMPYANYKFSIDYKDENRQIPFIVNTDTGVRKVYWFLNGKLLGEAEPDKPFFWSAEAGKFSLSVSDDLGRAASINFEVDFISY